MPALADNSSIGWPALADNASIGWQRVKAAFADHPSVSRVFTDPKCCKTNSPRREPLGATGLHGSGSYAQLSSHWEEVVALLVEPKHRYATRCLLFLNFSFRHWAFRLIELDLVVAENDVRLIRALALVSLIDL